MRRFCTCILKRKVINDRPSMKVMDPPPPWDFAFVFKAKASSFSTAPCNWCGCSGIHQIASPRRRGMGPAELHSSVHICKKKSLNRQHSRSWFAEMITLLPPLVSFNLTLHTTLKWVLRTSIVTFKKKLFVFTMSFPLTQDLPVISQTFNLYWFSFQEISCCNVGVDPSWKDWGVLHFQNFSRVKSLLRFC